MALSTAALADDLRTILSLAASRPGSPTNATWAGSPVSGSSGFGPGEAHGRDAEVHLAHDDDNYDSGDGVHPLESDHALKRALEMVGEAFECKEGVLGLGVTRGSDEADVYQDDDNEALNVRDTRDKMLPLMELIQTSEGKLQEVDLAAAALRNGLARGCLRFDEMSNESNGNGIKQEVRVRLVRHMVESGARLKQDKGEMEEVEEVEEGVGEGGRVGKVVAGG